MTDKPCWCNDDQTTGGHFHNTAAVGTPPMRMWWCATFQFWRATPCSCGVGGYDTALIGCGWVPMCGKDTDD